VLDLNVLSEPDDEARAEIEAERQRHDEAVEGLRSNDAAALRDEFARHSFRLANIFARMVRRKRSRGKWPDPLSN
jgi:hypothetical protein